MKSVAVSLSMIVLVITLQGCSAMCKGFSGAAKGGSDGFREGFRDDMHALKQADSWINEHMW